MSYIETNAIIWTKYQKHKTSNPYTTNNPTPKNEAKSTEKSTIFTYYSAIIFIYLKHAKSQLKNLSEFYRIPNSTI